MTKSVEDKSQDAAASVDTTYTMSVNDSFEGVLAEKSDEDWIRVELVEGKNYDIRLFGIGPDASPDTVLTIYDSDGEEIATNDDIELEADNYYSMLEFSPDSTGVYYIGAGSYQSRDYDNSGAYEITVFDEQDNNPETPLAVSVGERFQGTLDDKFDEDWIKVDLVEGKTYDITLDGIGADVDTDTILRIYNSEGEQVGLHDDVDYGAGKVNSRLSFSPEVTAAYYISVGAYRGNPTQDNSGRYQVAVYETDSSLTLTGTTRSDYLVQDRLTGSPGDDELDGKSGNDWLEGGAGADTLTGGTGSDLASYQYSDEGVEVRLDDGTARGGHAEGDVFAGSKTIRITQADESAPKLDVPEFEEFIISLVFGQDDEEAEEIEILDIETLFGSAHDDILVGNYGGSGLWGYFGDDVLDGKEGNDYLAAAGGADVLIGGAGIDTAFYFSSDEGVEVDLQNGVGRGGFAEGDTFPGMKTVEYVNRAGDTVEVEVPDIEDLIGSAHDDILVGAHGPNRLGGYRGDDVLDGREGDDWLDGGPGADLLRGGEGNDTASYVFSELTTGQGVEVRLHDGTARGGEAEGDSFDITVKFGDAEDMVQLLFIPDIENLHGSTLADILAGDLRDNTINGDAGDDVLYGGPDGSLDGGDDLLVGGPGDDRLYGGIGNDTLQGGPGDDRLRGGPDDDMLDGGEGDDTFVIAAGGGNDTVLDFGNGEDRIDLTAFAEIQSLEDLDMQQQENAVVIDLSAHGGGTVTLQDVDMTELMDAHFMFYIGEAAAMA